ncbi:MAG: stage V sporulation protein AD [Bacilli bacterium]|nr:stage V sporulation protein AD [Bacilli bacterium]
MTIKFDNVYVNNTSTVAGKFEKEGPLGKYFDKSYTDFYIGERSFEQGEMKMVLDSVGILLRKANMKKDDIDLFIAGDLTNQITSSSYSAEKLGINYIGVYAACSTSTLSIGIAGMMLQNKEINNCICTTSANNSVTEKQYRNPTEYGTPKPDTTTFTATGAGSILLSNKKSNIRVESFTIGKVLDYGINDVFNMGAAMAPSASYTINAHLKDMKRDASYYDLILTGDLGKYGKDILKEIIKKEHNIELKKYDDCGCMLYDLNKQDVKAGASGTTSSALVTYGYIIDQMKKGKLKKVLLVATGALMSPTMINQKLNIPSISHAISLEAI